MCDYAREASRQIFKQDSSLAQVPERQESVKLTGTSAQYNDGENKREGKIKTIKRLMLRIFKGRAHSVKKVSIKANKLNPLINISISQDQHRLSLYYKLPPKPPGYPSSQQHHPSKTGIFLDGSMIFGICRSRGEGDPEQPPRGRYQLR